MRKVAVPAQFCVESGLVQDLGAVGIQAGQENTDLPPAPQSNCHILFNGHDRASVYQVPFKFKSKLTS
jgi:hypothetical protein